MNQLFQSFGDLGGISIYGSEHIPGREPVLALSSKVDVSDEFRKRFDDWALDMFGETSRIYIFQGKMFANPTVVKAMSVRHD